MHLHLIAGARPNFMKIAPLIRALSGAPELSWSLIHTGQHYDHSMSGQFFEQLGIPEPHINLGAGGGTQAEQTAAIMTGYEAVLREHPADLCVVVGDVTSTMACAITARKMGVRVAHVEGGIRSGDWSMPEEINRVVTDSITQYFYTTSEVAGDNLRHSGVADEHIHFVGNTMIDTLLQQKPHFRPPALWDELGLNQRPYIVMTLHRPANVDQAEQLGALLHQIVEHTRGLPLVFPVHPRTARLLDEAGVRHPMLFQTGPMPYLEFNYLVSRAFAVVTDSGGITEETTVLGVPCMTLRDSTERPETVTMGTNELLGTDPAAIGPAMHRLFAGQWTKGSIPPMWDGRAAERIVAHWRALAGAGA